MIIVWLDKQNSSIYINPGQNLRFAVTLVNFDGSMYTLSKELPTPLYFDARVGIQYLIRARLNKLSTCILIKQHMLTEPKLQLDEK